MRGKGKVEKSRNGTLFRSVPTSTMLHFMRRVGNLGNIMHGIHGAPERSRCVFLPWTFFFVPTLAAEQCQVSRCLYAISKFCLIKSRT